MIGVVANPTDVPIVREFFELFKTPWEFVAPGREYEVVLCAEAHLPLQSARLVLHYSSKRTSTDVTGQVPVGTTHHNISLTHRGTQIKIYGNCASFPGGDFLTLLSAEETAYCAVTDHSNGSVKIRVGYDLFSEIGILLTSGQPAPNASSPTLDLHIALLRELIVENGVPLVEIPPSPAGYDFAVCLTHDVDHPSIRLHGLDHTTIGFLYRATIGSTINLFRGRQTAKGLIQNWAAALSLPFVHLGLAKDPWKTFDLYREIEAGLGSTFFVIPRRNDPGKNPDSSPRTRRSSAYGANDISAEINRLSEAGSEIGLHGIDAWLSAEAAADERDTIAQTTASPPAGVRMHWLYFGVNSHSALDSAGFLYDSTMGYNDTIGFRAGTAQVFRPIGSLELLELPLHIMDTALFYPSYLHLRHEEAFRRVKDIVQQLMRVGGVLTINWHDRSIAPERLWGGFYRQLITFLISTRAWFPTATEAVNWFKHRRSACIKIRRTSTNSFCLSALVSPNCNLPNLKLRIHNASPTTPAPGHESTPAKGYVDIFLKQDLNIQLTVNSLPLHQSA